MAVGDFCLTGTSAHQVRDALAQYLEPESTHWRHLGAPVPGLVRRCVDVVRWCANARTRPSENYPILGYSSLPFALALALACTLYRIAIQHAESLKGTAMLAVIAERMLAIWTHFRRRQGVENLCISFPGKPMLLNMLYRPICRGSIYTD